MNRPQSLAADSLVRNRKLYACRREEKTQSGVRSISGCLRPKRAVSSVVNQSSIHADRKTKMITSQVPRRSFLSFAGKGLGLAALTTPTVASLLRTVQAATRSVEHLT